MTAKHTPGPWKFLGKDAVGLWGIGPDSTTGEPKEKRNDGLVICKLYGPDWQANARLIIAAPETAAERDRLRDVNAELLAALKIAVADIDAGAAFGLNISGDNQRWANQARAAIAKAEG